MFLLSLRPRRVGGSPHCSACHHDLTGLPPESTRCPECGGDITRPRVITLGQRVGDPRRILPAGAALAVCLLLFSAVAYDNLIDVDTTTHKPLILLANDLTSRNAELRRAADTEILRRAAPPNSPDPVP